MGEFLLANLFLLALIGIAAGYLFLGLWILRAADLSGAGESWLTFALVIAVLFATYYTSKWLYGLVERFANRRAR